MVYIRGGLTPSFGSCPYEETQTRPVTLSVQHTRTVVTLLTVRDNTGNAVSGTKHYYSVGKPLKQ